jgi:Flp pilus assembly protein TadG
MRFPKSSSPGQRANALVEFALVLPVLLVITAGVIDLGRYAYFSIVVANAARAGAAYGSQSNSTAIDPSGMAAAADADVSSNPIATVSANIVTHIYGCYDTVNATMAVLPTATASCSASGQIAFPYVQVTTTGTIEPFFHVPFMPSSITVTSTALMRVQCIAGGC